jgi:hypothetical protein
LVTGEHPTASIAADFDQDGTVDLMSVNQFTNDVTLMRGFGDGTFGWLRNVAVGGLPTSGLLADVNNDGKPDLVTTSVQTQDVTVNLGDGTGGFGPKIRSPVSGAAIGLAVGDWNMDGKLDVATANATSNTASILLGNGAGGFGSLAQFGIGSIPKQIMSADFNADGKADLAIVNSGSANVQIWRGDGLGGFTLGNTLNTGSGSSPTGMTAADFNLDTRLDIAVSNHGADTVGVWRANGSGGFLSPITLSPGEGPRAMGSADLDNDGHLDLVVSLSKVSGTGGLAVMKGDSTGNFNAPTVNPTGPLPTTLSIADFNGDGNLDAVTSNLTANTLSILENLGTGTFVLAGKVTLPVGSFPRGVAGDDFNGDGKPDVAAVNEATDRISLALGDGLGAFPSVNSTSVTWPGPVKVITADFNRDTCPDLATANFASASFTYLQNNCSGSFTSTQFIIGCPSPTSISSGEISGDLFADIAVVCSDTGQLCTRRGTGTSGIGAFGASVCTMVANSPGGVAVGNYTLDALEDAAVTSSADNYMAIAVADGSGGVSDVPATFPVGVAPRDIVRGDLNGDEYQDLVVANSGEGTVSSMLGDGGGIFTLPAFTTKTGLLPTALALADFNLDGKMDVAVVNSNANNLSLLLGDGAGRFSKVGDFGTRDQPTGVAVGDFNQDGKPDLAVADNFNDTISILLNQSIAGDPLQMLTVWGGDRTVLRWGVVPGATYDIIRGDPEALAPGALANDLGPVTCLADDLAMTDTTSIPDSEILPVDKGFFYAVRSNHPDYPPSSYVVGSDGKPGVPATGGCP